MDIMRTWVDVPDETYNARMNVALHIMSRSEKVETNVLIPVGDILNRVLLILGRKTYNNSKKGEDARARYITAALMRSMHGLTQADIGKLLGGRDHSSINHNLRLLSPQYLRYNKVLLNEWNRVCNALKYWPTYPFVSDAVVTNDNAYTRLLHKFYAATKGLLKERKDVAETDSKYITSLLNKYEALQLRR